MTTQNSTAPATVAETPDARVGSGDWLGTTDGVMFASALRKMKAKLRKGWKHTIDTSDKEATEWPTFDHPVIEVKQGAQWLLLKMPDGTVFFKTADERDRIFAALPNADEMEAAELESAKANVRRTQEAAVDMARIARPQSGGQVRCAGCGCTYEDAPGNFCSFCA